VTPPEERFDELRGRIAENDAAIVAALSDGRLFRSGDQGDSWRPLEADGLTKVVAMAA